MNEPTDDDFISCMTGYRKMEKIVTIEVSIEDLAIIIYSLQKLIFYLEKHIKVPFVKFVNIERLIKNLTSIVDENY